MSEWDRTNSSSCAGALTVLAQLAARSARSTSAIAIALRSAVAEGQPVAAGELRRTRPSEPLNWLIIWHSVTVISPISTAKPSSSGLELHRHLAHAYLAGEGVGVAVAALRRIGQGQQEALVAAGQVLQAQRPRSAGKVSGCAGQVARFGAHRGGIALDQALLPEKVGRPAACEGPPAGPAAAAGGGGAPPAAKAKSSRRWV